MLQIATITFKALGKVKFKDIVVPCQNVMFGDFEVLRKICIDDLVCDDFVVLKIEFRKVEVFQ